MEETAGVGGLLADVGQVGKEGLSFGMNSGSHLAGGGRGGGNLNATLGVPLRSTPARWTAELFASSTARMWTTS